MGSHLTKCLHFIAAITFCTSLTLVATDSIAVTIDAKFCSNCTNTQEARAEAMKYAPPLQCTTNGQAFFGPDLSCTSTPKSVIFVNPDTDQVFSFTVSHQDYGPWGLVVTQQSLSLDVIDGLVLASKKTRDFRQSLDLLNDNNFFVVQGAITNNMSECPIDTALHTLSQPNFLNDAEIRARLAVAEGWDRVKNDSTIFSKFGIGLQYKGIGINVELDPSSQQPMVLVETYYNSEVESPFNDYLVYNITKISDTGPDSLPIVELSLSTSSRIAGVSINSGRTKAFVNSICAKKKFEAWVNNDTQATLVNEGGGNGGGFGVTDPNIPNDGNIIGAGNCSTIIYRQHGNNPVVYTFFVCN